jgi:hypothetical protein
VDFSAVIVNQLSTSEAKDLGIFWMPADVRNKRCKEQTVDVASDNGTLDAMIYGSPWYRPDNVMDNTRMYMNEVASSHDSVVLHATDCHRYFACWKMTAYFEADLNNVLIWCHSRLSRFEQFIPVTVAARF